LQSTVQVACQREAKIHRSHERVFNGLVVGIVVPPLCMHGCVHDKQPEIHCTFHAGQMVGNRVISDNEMANLTRPPSSCFYACPFNMAEDYPYSRQPCVYSVQIMEVFKGNYSVSAILYSHTGRAWGEEGVVDEKLTLASQSYHFSQSGTFCTSIV
jgi:hypothetical protein